MKNSFFFPLIVSAILVCSCIPELTPVSFEEVPDGDTVTINGTLMLPVTDDDIWSTKSFQDEPRVKKLYVAVFDDADMLYEIKEARPGTNDTPTDNYEHTGSANNYLTNFHVKLTRVPQGVRYVEFIAVGEDMPQLLNSNLMDESSLASTLVASGNTEAYFARREYVGITKDTDMKNIPMIRNFAKVSLDLSDLTCTKPGANVAITGFKVFNIPTNGMIAPFNANAPTTKDVRRTVKENGQYVEKTVTISNPDCFAQYDILPSSGAYDVLSKGGKVKKNGTIYEVSTADDAEVVTKYTGFMSNSVAFNFFADKYDATGTTDATFSGTDPALGGAFCPSNGADYLYECTYRAGADNPFIILKAEWTEGGQTETCYYKADFVHKENGLNTYYHILRNFEYTLSVTRVAAKGSDTIFEAVNGIAMNNFEASTLSQSLTNVSDGTSRLYISATDHLVTTGRIDTLYLCNKVLNTQGKWVIDDAQEANGTNLINGIKVGSDDYKKGEVVGRDDDLLSYCTFALVGSGDSDAAEWEGWVRAIITMPVPYNLRMGMVWKQPITFFNRQGVNRTCMITRRQPFEVSVDVQDYVAENKGQPCVVNISIPAGLTEARFPLEFYIEQEKNTLYPDASETPSLPVVSGHTQIPGNTGFNYYYTRIINWPEYKAATEDINGIKTFPSYFKTLVAQSATTVWAMPRQSDGYFSIYDDVQDVYTNQDTFMNSRGNATITFEKSSLTVQLPAPGEVAVPGVNVATASSGAPVVYSSDDPGVATVDEKGRVTGVSVGTARISATCGATGAYYEVDTPVSYTVTVIASYKKLPELEIRWKREPVYFFKSGGARARVYAIAHTNSTATPYVTYSTSNRSVADVVLDPQDGFYYVVPGNTAGTAIISATATVAATDPFVAETQTITYETRVITSGYAPSGTIFHQETFLERATNDVNDPDYTVIQSDYTQQWVTKPDGFVIHGQNNIWHLHTAGNYGAYASGWATDAEDWSTTEAWLVSREIDLTASRSAKLTFSHAAEYHRDPASMTPYCTVMIATEGNYNNKANWEDISPDVSQYPYPDYKFVAASVDLTKYKGQKVKIAFKYVSYKTGEQPEGYVAGNGCSWEVKNIQIKEK